MQPDLFHRRAPTPSRRLVIAPLTLLIVCAIGLLANATTADATLAERQQALEQVRDQQSDVTAELAASNDEINALIAQVSEARQREEAAATELAATEVELDGAVDELADGRAHLRDVRQQLDRMIGELEEILVGIYKSGDPEMARVLLESTSWEDASVEGEYLTRIKDYQANVVDRVRELRAEAAATVERLEEAKQQIAEARDAIATRHEQLASTRSGLEAQEAELAAARTARRDTLSHLAGREVELQDGIEAAQRRNEREASVPPPLPEPESDPAEVAAPPAQAPAPAGGDAVLNADGSATPPADAPPQVVAAIEAANAIRDKPYVWGGGHGSFEDSGYDCSGAVSYALNGGGFLASPLDSTGLTYWGESGPGSWITVYANSGHTYAVIAGLRWDTSGTSGSGPSWQTAPSYTEGMVARHPAGF